MTTSAFIRCRQCGHCAQESDFPTGAFRCPACDWREIIPRASSLEVSPEEETFNTDVSDAVGHAHDRHAQPTRPEPEPESPAPEGEAAERAPVVDLVALRALEPEAFVEWCSTMFGRFGYDVTMTDDADRDSDLFLDKDGDGTLADCRVADDQPVTRRACQRLVGAMVGAGVRRGILVTTGTFAASCRTYAAALPDENLRVDLIDGTELQATVEALSSGPLRKWYS